MGRNSKRWRGAKGAPRNVASTSCRACRRCVSGPGPSLLTAEQPNNRNLTYVVGQPRCSQLGPWFGSGTRRRGPRGRSRSWPGIGGAHGYVAAHHAANIAGGVGAMADQMSGQDQQPAEQAAAPAPLTEEELAAQAMLPGLQKAGMSSQRTRSTPSKMKT